MSGAENLNADADLDIAAESDFAEFEAHRITNADCTGEYKKVRLSGNYNWQMDAVMKSTTLAC